MRTIPTSKITQFLSELGTLLQTGKFSLGSALTVTQQAQEYPALAKLIGAIQKEIEAGRSLADSLANYPQYFEPWVSDLLKTDQPLSTTLANVAEYRQAMEASTGPLTKRLWSTLSYFLIVFLFFLTITTFMLIYVIPPFQGLFGDFGHSLPVITQGVVTLSEFLQDSWKLLVVMGFLFGGLLWWQSKWILLHLPLVGRLYRKIALIRFLRTCAFMLTHRASLPTALQASAQAVQFPTYAKLLQQLSQQVAAGTPFTDALQTQAIFPTNVIHAVLVGTQADQLDNFLLKLAEVYSEQVHQAIDPTIKIFSILLTIVIGVIIGLLVIAVYAPIFYLGMAI